jgi:hypothetical protein
MIGGKCAYFRAKTVELSGHLPDVSMYYNGKSMQLRAKEKIAFISSI